MMQKMNQMVEARLSSVQRGKDGNPPREKGAAAEGSFFFPEK
jgi:hypothetical protein